MRIAIPDLLSVRPVKSEDYIRADGMRVRRITLCVTANRTWNLHVVKDGAVVTTETGGRGTNLPVVVEVPLRRDAETPDAARLAYMLTAA